MFSHLHCLSSSSTHHVLDWKKKRESEKKWVQLPPTLCSFLPFLVQETEEVEAGISPDNWGSHIYMLATRRFWVSPELQHILRHYGKEGTVEVHVS